MRYYGQLCTGTASATGTSVNGAQMSRTSFKSRLAPADTGLSNNITQDFYIPYNLWYSCYNFSRTYCIISNGLDSLNDDYTYVYVLNETLTSNVDYDTSSSYYWVVQSRPTQIWRYNPNSFSNQWEYIDNLKQEYIDFDVYKYSCIDKSYPNSYNTWYRNDSPLILLSYFLIILMMLVPVYILWKRFRKR